MDKIKILIVEDNVITASDIAQRLKEKGFDICGMVDNAEEALKLVANGCP